MDTSGDLPRVRKKRCRVVYLRLAFVADKEVLKERAQSGDLRIKGSWNLADASLLEGAGAVISSRPADQSTETSGQEVSAEDASTHVAQFRAAEDRDLGPRSKF